MLLLRRLRPSLNLYFTKCQKHHEPVDEPIDEQFHMVPLGKSDINLQSRVSFLSKDMIEEKIVCLIFNLIQFYFFLIIFIMNII